MNSNNVCMKCEVEGCQRCEFVNNEPSCFACEDNLLVLNGACVRTCPNGYGKDVTGTHCFECDDNQLTSVSGECRLCSSIDENCVVCAQIISDI